MAAQSIFLLGPRFSGRRAILREIHQSLKAAGITPIIDLPIPEDTAVATEAELIKRVRTTVQSVSPQLRGDGHGLLGPIEALSLEQQKPIVLLVSNLDHLPYYISLRLLQNIWNLEQSGRITSVIAGGAQIRELIKEAKPGAVLPSTFFIQGLSRARFESRVRHSIRLLGFVVADEPKLCKELWKETRGNIYLERLIFNQFIESRLKCVTDSTAFAEKQPVTVAEVRQVLGLIPPLSSRIHIDSIQALSRNSDALQHLVSLLERPFGSSIRIPIEDGSPTVLELTGLVRRVVDIQLPEEVNLLFTSPLMERLARAYFDEVRLGDLHAENGQWEMAFLRYTRAAYERRIRPCNDEDRIAVSAIVRRLGDQMKVAADEGVWNVDELFERGCHCVLGYADVIATYWQSESARAVVNQAAAKVGWAETELPQPYRERLLNALGPGMPKADGFLELHGELAQTIRAFALPEMEIGRQRVVIIGDFSGRIPISQTRYELLADLCQRYRAAREAALDSERHRRQLKVFRQELRIITRIFEALREETMDLDGVLRYAAEQMSQLGYRVVAFGFPNLEKTKINCVQYFDKSCPTLPANQWPNPKLNERHLAIFHEEQHWFFQTSDLNREMVILPLHEGPHTSDGTERGRVVATMQVEREGNGHLSQEEIEDLRFFGDYLMSGTAQSIRNQLLQYALARINEPVIISDHELHLRYANPEAARLFDVKSAWYDSSNAPDLPADAAKLPTVGFLKDAVLDHKETIAHRLGIGSNPRYRGRVTAAPITNSRNSPIGAVLHIQDLNETHRILEALEQVVSAKDEADLLTVILELALIRGHAWARVYSVQENGNVLVGRYMRGPNQEEVKRFETGAFRIPNIQEYQSSWECFQHVDPVILALAEEGKQEATQTDLDLPVVVVRDSPWKDFLVKRPGDLWMDVPLKVGQQPYAKLTLHCSRDIRPDTVEFWRTVATSASRVLELLKNAMAERLYIAERLLHRLQSLLAPLSGIHGKYHRYATRAASAELHQYNEELKATYNEAVDKIQQEKGIFREIVVKPQAFDLRAMLKTTIDKRLLDQRSEVSGPTTVFYGDEDLLRAAFEEMLNNSMRVYADMVAESKGVGYDDAPTVTINLDRISKPDDPRPWITIVVADNGPGIGAGKAPAVVNGSNNGHGGRGAGFGLVFVADVLRAHGGSIRVLPEQGPGAVFLIELPEQIEQKGN